ncbi:tetratricopeptide repeat-containing sensor histidine kinase [Flavobacterium cerinum]|uniref:Tetratricopeptide repeat-containing sensor histidine kinase n=1 Tax=Flavobacterium cerinum TaxID=2502784 RepID=A0A3S3QLS4_9FLAO|nr:tetratricopeptide repeat-containing sensor histidine kinase [Flavobacterium cerinum]RWW92154.1 tetratricopeptide repeat-containing sensor histidine kinase [Flavobacterium cerinum]
MKKYLLFFLLFFCTLCFPQEEADALLQQGVKEISGSNYEGAIAHLNQSVAIAKEAENKEVLSKAYVSLGEAYAKSENFTAALKNYLLALPILKTGTDRLAAANASKEIGVLYGKQKKHDLSLQYFTEAFKQAKQLNNEMLSAECLGGIGSAYEAQSKIDKALESYSQALAIYRARGHMQNAGQMLSNMGNAYKLKGDYLQSILNYKEALGYFNSANDRHKVAKVLSSLGKVLALMEDHNESLRLYEQAYLDAIEIKYDEVIIESSLGMAAAYENLRQYPESVRYHKIYEQKKDSFVNAAHEKELAQLKLKGSKNNDENVVVIEAVDSAGMSSFSWKYTNFLIIGCVAFALVLLTGAYIWRRNLLKGNKEDRMFREAEGEERLRLVQDIHLDLDSKLSEINHLSEAIVEKTTGMPTIRSKGEAMQETTKKIEENIRDLVWLLTPRTTILTNYVGSIKEYVLGYFKDTHVEVLLSTPDGISINIINKESQRELLSVIKENLESIANDPQATKVFFGITYSGTRLMVSIKDNGIGTETTEADRKRMENSLNSIGGIMRIDSEAGWGTTVKIIIPIAKPK